MLKKRIIPKFLIRGGSLVKGIHFKEPFRMAGNPVSTAKVYDAYGADELVLLDIEATPENRSIDVALVKKVSEAIFMPLTVGGGINNLDHIADLLLAGADKVCINSAAVEKVNFIQEAAVQYGSQCIVVGIDYKTNTAGQTRVFSHCGKQETQHDVLEWALRVQDAKAGEIMLCSMDRDGSMSGYDLDLIGLMSDRLEIPVIASSGAGTLQHCYAALQSGASGITISSMFFFSDHSPIKVRSYLATNGIAVRAQQGSYS